MRRIGEVGYRTGEVYLVNLPDLVGLRVHGSVVHVLVVHAVLLYRGDAELRVDGAGCEV